MSIQAKYQGSVNYGNFTKGKLVQETETMKVGYWNGCHSIRVGTKHTYILIAGSHYIGNSLGSCAHIFTVPNGTDISYLGENLSSLIWDEELIVGADVTLISQADYHAY